jgi:hypothetical protein
MGKSPGLLELTLGERTLFVRAGVVEGVQRAADVRHGDACTLHIERCNRTNWYVRDFSNGHEFGFHVAFSLIHAGNDRVESSTAAVVSLIVSP